MSPRTVLGCFDCIAWIVTLTTPCSSNEQVDLQSDHNNSLELTI